VNPIHLEAASVEQASMAVGSSSHYLFLHLRVLVESFFGDPTMGDIVAAWSMGLGCALGKITAMATATVEMDANLLWPYRPSLQNLYVHVKTTLNVPSTPSVVRPIY
jgi:hypothetical protein